MHFQRNTHWVEELKSMLSDCKGLYCFFALQRFKNMLIGWFQNYDSRSFLFCKLIIKIGYFENNQIMIKWMFSKSLFIRRWDFPRSNVRMKNYSFWNHVKFCIRFMCWYTPEKKFWLARNPKFYILGLRTLTHKLCDIK